MNRFADRVAIVCEIAAALIVAAIFGIMLFQIWFRYVLNSSLLWSEEFALFGLIWLVLLGSVALMRDWKHVNIPIFVMLMPAHARALLVILAKVVTLAFLLFLVWNGLDVFGGSFHRMSPMLGISTKWSKLAIPVGALLMAILVAVLIVNDVRGLLARGVRAFDDYGRHDQT